jgi:hypothetical protein
MAQEQATVGPAAINQTAVVSTDSDSVRPVRRSSRRYRDRVIGLDLVRIGRPTSGDGARFRASGCDREADPECGHETQDDAEDERAPERQVDGAQLVGRMGVIVVAVVLAVVVESVRLAFDVARMVWFGWIVGRIVDHRLAGTSGGHSRT